MKMKMLKVLGKKGRITIPFEIRQRVGFTYNDILSFTEAPDGQSVIVKRERICDECSAERAKALKEDKDNDGSITLFELLNGLTEEQQKAAFAHLGAKLVSRPAGTFYGRS